MNRNNLREKAQRDYESWKEFYKEEIQYSIENSTVYDNWKREQKETPCVPEITVEDLSTQQALHKYCKLNPAALNFASYKHPGGGYLGGAWAQEESLCHSSVLYNVLEDFIDEYLENMNQTNHGLYRDWAIYSPKIQFTENWSDLKKEQEKFNILTCPAPNLSSYGVEDKLYETTLLQRVKFVLDIFSDNSDETIILGAFGCGVFGNNPKKVAEMFKDHLTSGGYSFKRVVFAIPGGENYIAFKKVFNGQ